MFDKRDQYIPVSTNVLDTGVFSGEKDRFASIPKWVPVGCILLVTALVYSRSLFNDLTNFDDNNFILNNPLVKNTGWEGIKALFTSFHSGKYQPLTTFTFLLENKFFGFDPLVFHMDNVLLHLACTWVVYKVAGMLSGKRITALVVAALFALHPMHVEEVAWASERKDLMYALFYLLALWSYLKYIGPGARVKYYAGMFLLFLLSLLCKSSAITLPVALVAIDIYKRRGMNKKVWLEKAPMLFFSVLFIVLGSMSRQAEGVDYHMQSFVSVTNRLFLAASVPSFYIVKLFAPFGLSAMHYYPDINGGTLPWIYYASLPFLLFIAWLLIRRSALRREMIFGLSFFLITIAVMEQIVTVGPSLTPERYTYIPYIGFFYIAGQWLSNIPAGKYRTVSFGLFTLFLVMFAVQTWARIAVWKNTDSIFKDVLDNNEGSRDCYYIYFTRGDMRAKEGDLRDAILDYNQAIILNPKYAQSYASRGVALFQAGDAGSALSDFNNAIRLNPKHAKQYDNRASVKAGLRDFSGAINDYDHYLQMEPADSRAYTDRGMVHLSLHDSSAACADWKRAMELGDATAPQLLHQYCH